MRACFCIILMTLAAASPSTAREQTLQQMITNANAATLKHQPALYIDIAERQLKSARELYDSGKVNEARGAVADVVTYSQKAHDSAVQSGKRLKQTEMASRKMSLQLQNLKRTLNFDDQAPVQAAADRLEGLAQDLLNQMFKKEK
jgi:hypothetical protein